MAIHRGFPATVGLVVLTLCACQAEPARVAPLKEVSRDGAYSIGDEIYSGTYETDGPRQAAAPCEWSVLFEGRELRSGVLTGPGQVDVDGEVFMTRGCATWVAGTVAVP